MKYQTRMTETAKQDLRAIAWNIAEQSGEVEIAKRFITELKGKCGELKDFPHRGALPKDHILLSMGYRYLTYKSYLIFYITDEEKKIVEIIAVFHEKMDYTRMMRKYI